MMQSSFSSPRRVIIITIGVVAMLLGFGGTIALNTLLAPPTARVAVAARDIARGERLRPDLIKFVSMRLPSQRAKLDYITEAEVKQYLGRRSLDVIRKDATILKSHLLDRLTDGYYDVLLDDPNNVAVVLDARDLLPPFVRVGDQVNIFVMMGTGNFGGDQLPNLMPTPTPLSSGPLFFPTPVPSPTPTTETITDTQSIIAPPEALPTPTPTPAIVQLYPSLMLLLENVPIVNILRREQRDDQPGQGPIERIAVIVPAKYQSWLLLANNTRSLRFTVSTAARTITETIPTRPIGYSDFVQLYMYQLEESQRRGETISGSLYSQYLQMYYPEEYSQFQARQRAWFERERGRQDPNMDNAVKERLLP